MFRGVAQFGRVPEWGSGGRWFESSHSDHVGMDFAPFRFFYCIKKSVIRAVIPPFSTKAGFGRLLRLRRKFLYG